MTPLAINIVRDLCSAERRLSPSTLRDLGRATTAQLAEAVPDDSEIATLLSELRTLEEKAHRLQEQMGLTETKEGWAERMQVHIKVANAFTRAKQRELAAARLETDAMRREVFASVSKNYEILQMCVGLVNFPGMGGRPKVNPTAAELRDLKTILHEIGALPSLNSFSSHGGIQNATNFMDRYTELKEPAFQIIKNIVARIPAQEI